VLKKDLYFDPEFWNLIALRTSCLKLMSEKVVSAALEEIMEDKWISKYCTRGSALRSVCQRETAAKKRRRKEDRFCKRDSNTASKRFKVDTEKMRLNNHALRRRGNQGSQALRESSSGPLRRSFWQLDRIHGSLTLRFDEHRRTTRFSERNLPKRKIKKPKWLLEDSGTLENVPLKIKRNGLKQQKLLRSCVMKRSQTGPIKNSAKLKPPGNTHQKAKESNDYQNGFSLDSVKPVKPPQIILELSLPDNELMDTFNDDSCNRPKRFSQVLLYKPTVKYPDTSPPAKTGHGKEVILRSRDATMFVRLLHCYARRPKGKGSASNVHGSVSTITRSSAQGSPSKDPELCERPVSGPKGATPEKGKERGLHVLEKLSKAQSTKDASRIPQAETEKLLQNKFSTEGSPAVTEGTTAAPTSAATHVTEIANVHDVPQAQSIASGGEAFEESAVEMKVTIASQASVLDKVSKSPTREDLAHVSQISKVVKNKKKSPAEILPVSLNSNDSDDALLSQCEDNALNRAEQDMETLSTQEDGSDVLPDRAAAEVLRKSPKGNVKNMNSAAACSSTVGAGEREESTQMLESEMITEPSPGEFPDQEKDKHVPGLSKSPKGKGKPKGAEKTHTTSSSTVREQEASLVDLFVKKENAKADTRSETSENSELLETPRETEESKLEHYCTFCSKFFMGTRVVEHAMFHFRKDECTFCRSTFKDDLMAMMHLSDHIEKMKRLKAEENGISTPKTSAKAKTTNVPPGHTKEKPKKSAASPQSSADTNPPESRMLRSNQKQTSGTSSHEKETLKHVSGEAAVHRVNGHIGKKNKYKGLKDDSDSKQQSARQQSSEEKTHYKTFSSRLRENKQIESKSSESAQTSKEMVKSSGDGKKKRESLQLQQTDSKLLDVGGRKNVELQEKVSCPAKRCSWFTELLKNRVGLLYHALDKHYGDIKPLELAFRVGNGKCSICMRVMWSFEHFQHHVERHRLVPRHPCLHRGCTARFKSGMEMRRHARKHSPLQAMCCRPGCSQLFICLWALNLHEREHYASKPAEPDSSANAQRDDKPLKTPDGKKSQSSEDTFEPVVRNATLRLREQARNNSLKRNIKARVSASSAAQQQNKLRMRNKSIDYNESERDASLEPTALNLRLRQTLRKDRATNQAPKIHKVVSSSLLKHKSKVKSRLRLKDVRIATRGLKRRACPPRLSKTAAGQKRPSQDTVMLTRVSTKTNKDAQDDVIITETTANDSKSNASEIKQVTRNQTPSKSQSTSLNQSGFSDLHRQKPTVDRKKTHMVRNHCVPSDSSKLKKNKIRKGIEYNKAVEMRQKQSSASKKPAESEPVKVKAAVEGSADEKAKKQDSAHLNPSNSVLAVLAEGADMPPTTEKPLRSKMEGISKISGVRKEENTNTAALSSVKPTKKKVNQKVNPAGCPQTPEEKEWSEDVKSTPCKETLAAYSKKPYLRLPPTAYLDEKYTTMPKRRKEMPFFQHSREGIFPESACLKAALQRHRCAKCFSTFSSTEELQSHNQLQKCSNLFGFDSDDEGEFGFSI
ncbi:hypothetical protein GOODEAATRI_003870, partial [Goodea atripinnis]